MTFLKQSTSVDVGIGPFLDETDGKTAETALTITQPDIRLKKNGGAWAQKNAAQTLTHEENGWYEVTLDSTDTNTLGILKVAVHESGALPVWLEFMVVPAEVYDALFGTGLAEPSGVPAWPMAFPTGLAFLLALATNKMTQNRSTGVTTLRDRADSTDIATHTDTDNGTTFTRPSLT